MTLTEFLLARIEEDEEVAYANIEPPPGYRPRSEDNPLVLGARRVLAECDAKRRIVELHTGWHECTAQGEGRKTVLVAPDYTEIDPTLSLLVLPYADHPDYRDEWHR